VCRTADLGIGRGYVKLLQIVVMTARLVGGRLSGVKDGVDGGDVVASVAAGNAAWLEDEAAERGADRFAGHHLEVDSPDRLGRSEALR
jgi:hypothetical protein